MAKEYEKMTNCFVKMVYKFMFNMLFQTITATTPLRKRCYKKYKKAKARLHENKGNNVKFAI